MEKLKERFDIDLKENYRQVSFVPNLLLLNKKVYLLYNYFNKRKEFLLLNYNKNSRYIFNYIGFFSLNFFLNIRLDTIKFDYFKKWSSSFLQYDEGITRTFFDDINDIKKLVEPMVCMKYIISDNIFNNYNVGVNNYFYLNKNNYIYNLFFKLSKKDDIKLKPFYLSFLLEYYFLLNNNYNEKLNVYNWTKKIKWNFILDYIMKIKFHFIKKIKKNIFFYFFYKNEKNIFFHFYKKNNIYYFFRNFYKNKKKLKFFLFLQYFQHLHFLKKFNKRFFGFNLKFPKKRSLEFFLKKFLPTIYIILNKNIKKKTLLSFIKKSKKKSIIRNFFTYIFNLKFNDKIITKKNFFKKKKKVKSYRIMKKLNTFYYIPDTEKTKKQVYKRFKRSVFRKFKRKKLRKKKRRVIGLYFNLSVYNHRNRYKHRMKMLALKKNITPKFHFYKHKQNNYKFINSKIVDIKYKEVPFFVKRRYKLKIEKKKKKLFLKRADWMKYKIFKKIKNQAVKKNKEDWITLYKKSSSKFRKKTFFKYISFFKDKWKNHKKKKRKKYIEKWKNNTKSYKLGMVKKNNAFWFFQKVLLYWKNLLKLKKKENFINLNYMQNCFNSLKKIYKQLFFLSVKIFNCYILKNCINNSNSIYNFIKKYIFFYKIYIYIFIFFIKKINSFKKINKINIVRWLKKKKRRRRKLFFFFKKRRKLMLLKKREFLNNNNIKIEKNKKKFFNHKILNVMNK